MVDLGFLAALLAGITGSVHCLAMCGGYAVAGVSVRAQPLLPARRLRLERVVTQLGRLGTYVLLGAAFGAAGGAAFALQWPAAQRVLYVAANLVLIVTAIRLASPVGAGALLEHAGLAVFRQAARVATPVLSGRSLAGRFALGSLWGLTPCALIYGLLPVALLSGSAWRGGLVMAGLWLGTLPALLLATTLTGRLSAPASRRAAAVAVALFGLAGLYRALAAPGTPTGAPFCFGG
jgi:sulfite exporter TauE/SafE